MQAPALYAETSRLLQTMLYTSSSPGLLTQNLPLDTVLKAVGLRLSGSVVVTWSSTGYAKETSTISDLLTSVSVEVDGSRIVKNVYPHIWHMESLLAKGVQGERRCATGAAAKYNNNPLTDAGFTIPTSTQYTTVAESVFIPLEMIFATENGERETTWLDLRGKSSAVLKLNCAAVTNLDKTTNLAFSSINFQFQPVTYEAKDFPQQPVEYDWRETFKVQTFSAAATDQLVDLPRGSRCEGISLFVREDAAGAGAASTSFRPSNNAVRQIRVRRDGREILSTTFQDLQGKNRRDYGVNAAFSSSQSRLDGFARINFLTAGKLNSALDVSRESGINSFELLLTVAANDPTNNIMPVDVMIHTGEIVARPR